MAGAGGAPAAAARAGAARPLPAALWMPPVAAQRQKRGTDAGRGKSWTRAERVALCNAVRKVTPTGILAATQGKRKYWGGMLTAMAEQTPDKLTASQLDEGQG